MVDFLKDNLAFREGMS